MTNRTTALITRHGLSEHNLNVDTYMGRSPESRLVDQGRDQARHLGERLAGYPRIDQVVCSSLPRTTETATIIGRHIGIDEPQPEDGFWELSKGEWEGKMSRNLAPDLAEALRADPFGFRYPGGESFADVVKRVGPVFDRWVQTYTGQTVLFVLHGDVIRALLHHMIQFPPEKIMDFVITPCSFSEFFLSDKRWTTVRYNDTSHLSGELGQWPPPDRPTN